MNSKTFKILGLVYFILFIGFAISAYFYQCYHVSDYYEINGPINAGHAGLASHYELNSISVKNYSDIGTQFLVLFSAMFFLVGNFCLYWSAKLKKESSK